MQTSVASERQLRVVVFGSGPVLEADFKQFLVLLQNHASIDLSGVFCQSAGSSLVAVARDLFRRRGLLGLPLLMCHILGGIGAKLLHPLKEARIRQAMRSLNDRIHWVRDIHAESVLQEVCAQKPDLGLVYGSPILKPRLFEIPKCGTLGIHHGDAPRYRGKKTTFWTMYNNEPEAGVIIQKITSGLDSGSIVRRGTVPIGRRSYRAVSQHVLELGFALYLEAIEQVHANTAVFTPQPDGEKGPLYRDPTLRDILRFWFRRFRRPAPVT